MTLENPQVQNRKYIFIHGRFSIVILVFGGGTLPETNSSPLKIGHPPKGNKKVFQQSMFRCKLAVSFREGNYWRCFFFPCFTEPHTYGRKKNIHISSLEFGPEIHPQDSEKDCGSCGRANKQQKIPFLPPWKWKNGPFGD